MNEKITDFESWCQSSWCATTRSHSQLLAPGTPQIRDHADFDKIAPPVKVHIAEKLILESYSRMGALVESGDVTWYIHKFGRELQTSGSGFKGRRLQPLKAALLLTSLLQFSSALPPNRSDCDHIRAGGGAMATMYLLAQLEFLCRVKGRYLDKDGTIKRTMPQQLRKKAGLQPNQRRVNQIHKAFIVYMYRNTTALGKRLRILETKLGIAKRLQTIRNPVMHGELPDPAVEGKFFGLLLAMFYYSGLKQHETNA